MRRKNPAATALALSVASTLHAQQHIFVDDDAANGGDGLSWQSPLNDLQAAIDLAESLGASRGEIRIAGGTYIPHANTGDVNDAFTIPQPGVGESKYDIKGGYAGLEVPTDPDARDTEKYPTLLTADLFGDDFPISGNRVDNSDHIVVIEGGEYIAGAPVSAVSLDGLCFRGAASAAITNLKPANNLNISNCLFEDNYGGAGCAVLLRDSFGAISRCTIQNNHFFNLDTPDSGGTVRLIDSRINIHDCCFISNNAVNAHGGAIHVYGGTTFVTNSYFNRNTSAGDGGAVYAREASVRLTQCELDFNSAHRGGAVYFRVADSLIINCDFRSNTAGSLAGAVSTTGGELYITSSEFQLNHSSQSGGAVHATSDLYILDSIFRDNSTENSGGGVAKYGPQYSEITSSVFAGNSAKSDGGAAVGITYLEQCNFENNSSGERGGAVHVADYVISCFFEGNNSSEGGALYNPEDSSCITTDSVFVNNSATFSGSAIRTDADLDLIRSTLSQSNKSDVVPLLELSNGTAWVESSIIWDDRPTSVPVIRVGNQATLAALYCSLPSGDGQIAANSPDDIALLGNNTFANPLLLDIGAGNVNLAPGSPCIDAAFHSATPPLPAIGADGQPRFAEDDSGVANTGFGVTSYLDIGAIEFTGTSCLPDVNGDGTLSSTDFIAWINAFNNNDPECDQNSDGSCTPTDFTAWIGNFNAGC